MASFPQHLQVVNPQINVPKSVNENFSSIFLSKFVNPEFIQRLSSLLLYQSDLSGSLNVKSTEVVKFINQFLYNIKKDINSLSSNVFSMPNTVVQTYLSITKQLLDLRDDVSSRLVTYDNVLSHFPKRDVTTDKFLHLVSTNRIGNITEFRTTLDYILQIMQAYNELKEVRKTLSQWLLFTENATKDDVSIFNTLKEYKETIINAYNDLSALQVLIKNESLSDYIILSDVESIQKVSKDVITFLESGYAFYKTGYPLIDNSVGGIESGSVSIITGPSNHAKSIFMINLFNRIILNNVNQFGKNSACVFITLEDDAYKVLRRFISIFGNFDSNLIRKAWIRSSQLLKEEKSNTRIQKKVFNLITELLNESVRKVTEGKVTCILKHCNENSFTPADASKFIDTLKMQGYDVCFMAIDYIDVMYKASIKWRHLMKNFVNCWDILRVSRTTA
jgi:hypothetical protein